MTDECLTETNKTEDSLKSISDDDMMDQLALQITKVSGNEKEKVVQQLVDLVEKNKKEKENREKEKQRIELKIQKEKEDAKLKKYKELFEKRIACFAFACFTCQSRCQERETSCNDGNVMCFALLCTNNDCIWSKNFDSYGCAKEYKSKCVRKIFFKDL